MPFQKTAFPILLQRYRNTPPAHRTVRNRSERYGASDKSGVGAHEILREFVYFWADLRRSNYHSYQQPQSGSTAAPRQTGGGRTPQPMGPSLGDTIVAEERTFPSEPQGCSAELKVGLLVTRGGLWPRVQGQFPTSTYLGLFAIPAINKSKSVPPL